MNENEKKLFLTLFEERQIYQPSYNEHQLRKRNNVEIYYIRPITNQDLNEA